MGAMVEKADKGFSSVTTKTDKENIIRLFISADQNLEQVNVKN
jgi:hypothetical protein